MAWIPAPAVILEAVCGGLADGYDDDGNELRWCGERPGPGWHIHDWVRRSLLVFDGRRLVGRVVLRRRWLLAGTTQTRISRCPDERRGTSFSGLVVPLALWAWLAGCLGVTTTEPLHPALSERPAPRTLQRWLGRLLPRAAFYEQVMRDTVLEVGSEPWPAERLFPGGLPPPEELTRRRWAEPDRVSRTYRALLWLLGGAARLGLSIPFLLARARGRWPNPRNQLLI